MARNTIPPMDLMFFLTESPQSPKHVGAVQVFDLPRNAPANYLRDLVDKIDSLADQAEDVGDRGRAEAGWNTHQFHANSDKN